MHDKYFKEQISQDHFKKLWMEKTKKNWKLFEEQRLTFKQQQEQRIIDIWKLFGKTINSKDARNIFNEYLSEYEKNWKAFVGINKLLKEIKIEIGILSNGNLQQQIKKLKTAKLLSYFDKKNIFTSEEIGIAKPDPKLFLFITRKLKLKPGEILYIGDNPEYDIKPALEANWQTVCIDHHNLYRNNHYKKSTNTKELKSLLEQHGENIFCDNK